MARIDLRRWIARIGYLLLLAWILLFVVLVGHVWWDDPDRLRYITRDIWVDIFTVMIGVPLAVFVVWRLVRQFVGPQHSGRPLAPR